MCSARATVADVAKEYGIDVLGRLPIDPKLATACDNGEIEDFEGHWLDDAVKKLRSRMRFSGTIFYETHPLMLQKQKL